MTRTRTPTVSVEFLGPWGSGKSTLAEQTRALLEQSDRTFATAAQCDQWRRVAGMWSPQRGPMSLTQRAAALFRGSLMSPAVAGLTGARLARAWLAHRGRGPAWAARKTSIVQRALAARGGYDVIVWDEGALALCASALNRDPLFRYNELVTALLEAGYDERWLFVLMTGDVGTLIDRQQLRHPLPPASPALSQRVDRLKRALEFWQFVGESLARVYPDQLLWLDAARPAVANAGITHRFVTNHQLTAATSGTRK